MNHTLILYKSDGYNTSMGCVMEQWGSNFSLDTNVSETDAINSIAGAFTAPREGGSYEAHLITARNNEQIHHRFEQFGCPEWRQEVGGVSTTSQSEDCAVVDADMSEGERLNNLIRAKVSQIIDAQNKAKEKAKNEQKEQEAKKKELFERQQLEALKKKYEGTN